MKKFKGVFVFSLIVIAIGYLQATTFKSTTISKLVSTSTHIIKGKVVSVEPYWTTDKKNDIYTNVVIKIDEVLKGDISNEVVITLRGGQIGDLRVEVDYMPVLKSGDEGVFFLINHKGKFWIHSIAMGYYQLLDDHQTGKRIVYSPIGNSVVENDVSLAKLNAADLNQKYDAQEFLEVIKGVIKNLETK